VAGLLNWRSDLTIREIIGLLGVEHVARIELSDADDSWTFIYQDAPLQVERIAVDHGFPG